MRDYSPEEQARIDRIVQKGHRDQPEMAHDPAGPLIYLQYGLLGLQVMLLTLGFIWPPDAMGTAIAEGKLGKAALTATLLLAPMVAALMGMMFLRGRIRKIRQEAGD